MPVSRLKTVQISTNYKKIVCDSCWLGVPIDEKEIKDGKVIEMGVCEDCSSAEPLTELVRIRISEHAVKDMCKHCLNWEKENGRTPDIIYNKPVLSEPTSSNRNIKLPDGKAISIGDLRELLTDI